MTGGIAASESRRHRGGGAPHLAEERVGAVSALLLNYGVAAIPGTGNEPPNRAVVEITRTLVTLPACPNWSKPSGTDFGNQPSSNLGCATETNLGMMIANPTDLATGLRLTTANGQPASAAVNRYLNDKVTLPTANTALPIAVQSSSQQGGSGNNPSSAGTGSGSGSQ